MSRARDTRHKAQLGDAVRAMVDRAKEVTGSSSQTAIAELLGVSRQTLVNGMKGETFGLNLALRLADLADASQDEKRRLVWLLMVRLSKEDRCARYFVNIVETLRPLVADRTWKKVWAEAVEGYIVEEE